MLGPLHRFADTFRKLAKQFFTPHRTRVAATIAADLLAPFGIAVGMLFLVAGIEKGVGPVLTGSGASGTNGSASEQLGGQSSLAASEYIEVLLGAAVDYGIVPSILVGAVIGCVVALIASALMLYFASVWARQVGRATHKAVTKVLVGIASSPAILDAPDILGRQRDFQKTVIQSALHTGNAVESLLRLISNVFTPVALLLYLGYLQTEIVGWLLLSGTATALLFVSGARRISSSAAKFYSHQASEYGSAVSRLLVQRRGEVLARRSGESAPPHNDTLEPFPLSSSVSEKYACYQNGYDRIQLAGAVVGLVSSFMRIMLVGLCILLIYLNRDRITFSFGELILFPILLFMCLSYLQSLATGVSRLGIYYPQVKRFMDVQEAATKAHRSPGNGSIVSVDANAVSDKSNPRRKKPSKLRLDVKGGLLEVGSGSVVEAVIDKPVNVFSILPVVKAIATRGRPAPSDDDLCILLSPDDEFPAAGSVRWIFIDANTLRELGRDRRDVFLALHSEAIIVVVRRLSQKNLMGITHAAVAILDGQIVRAWESPVDHAEISRLFKEKGADVDSDSDIDESMM